MTFSLIPDFSYVDISYYIKWIITFMMFQSISRVKLSPTQFWGIPFIYLLVGWYIDPIEAYFDPLYLLVTIPFITNYKKYNPTQYLFYGLAPVVIYNVLISWLARYFRFVMQYSLAQAEHSIVLEFGIIIGMFPIYYLFFKILKFDFNYLRQGVLEKSMLKFVKIINLSMILYIIPKQWLRNFEIMMEDGTFPFTFNVRYIMTNLLIIFTIFFISAILYYNNLIKGQQEAELKSLKEKQLTDLENYSSHVENLYLDIKKFRHDYTNILISLNQAIQEENIDQIKNVYNDVIKDSGKQFVTSKYEIGNLSNVKNSSIKSILSSKLFLANEKKIDLAIEIPSPIELRQFNERNFIQIISILLDNAIEATILSDSPKISIAFLEIDDKQIFAIENQTKEKKININVISKLGYSTKGTDRGIGLSNIKDILSRYDNVVLNTESNHYKFKQELVIYNDSK